MGDFMDATKIEFLLDRTDKLKVENKKFKEALKLIAEMYLDNYQDAEVMQAWAKDALGIIDKNGGMS